MVWSAGNTLEGNIVESNVTGIDCSGASGNFVTGNRARNNTGSDYFFLLPGNTYGQIVDMTSGGQISTTDPHANFRF